MNVGVATSSREMGICRLLRSKEEELKKHSIYTLDDDSNADFDFFVLVDSKKMREENEFLGKLNEYVRNRDRGLLDSPDPKDPGLKVLIEKYPYRLFVVIDRNDLSWQVDGESPLDKDFWRSFDSEFIKKRICWIDKEELKALTDDGRYNFKLRLFFEKWINHLIHSHNHLKQIKRIRFEFIGLEERESHFAPITSLLEYNESLPKGDGNIVFNAEEARGEEEETIAMNRHNVPDRGFMDVALSGSQFMFPLVRRIAEVGSKDEFYYLTIESACLSWCIVDERVVEYFEGMEERSRLTSQKVYPLSEMRVDSKIFRRKASIRYEMCLEKPFKVRGREEKEEIDADLMILHQGIIDKLQISEEKLLYLKDYIPFLMVTSGRGKPPNLPRGTKFIPFSVISFFLLKDYPEKILADEILMRTIAKGEK